MRDRLEVAFDQNPAAWSLPPMGGMIMSIRVWRVFPISGRPDVSAAIPNIMAGDPYMLRCRRSPASLDNHRWRGLWGIDHLRDRRGSRLIDIHALRATREEGQTKNQTAKQCSHAILTPTDTLWFKIITGLITRSRWAIISQLFCVV
jgi:hypothetical protein